MLLVERPARVRPRARRGSSARDVCRAACVGVVSPSAVVGRGRARIVASAGSSGRGRDNGR
eukprot:11200138-Lingulodinium_polyedra.AAC.1